MAEEPAKARVLLHPEVWGEGDDGFYLRPSRCAACGLVVFPPLPRCPGCLAESVESAAVVGEGALYSYTTIHVPRKGYPTPYSVGFVDFPNGMRVFGRLMDNGPFRLGMRMSVTAGPIREDDGTSVWSYMFSRTEAEA